MINKIVSAPKELLDDINLATNTTFSSVRIDSLISDTLQQANTHAEAICNALTKLTCEKTTVQPTLDNSEKNVIYLYSADGNAPFEQFLKISDTELIDMGSTSISLNDYLTITDAVATYCKKTDFDALNTEVTNVKNTLGTDSLTTTSQTVTGAINELNDKSTITTLSQAEYNQLVADGTVDADTYYIISDDSDNIEITQTISSSSTENEVPSAKAVYDNANYTEMYDTSSNTVTEILNGIRNIKQKKSKIIRLYDGTGTIFGVSGNYIGLVTAINGNEITCYFVNHWNPSVAYTCRIESTDTELKLSRVCTTKVADVDKTIVTFTDKTNYNEISSSSLNYYIVKNGICYVHLDVNVISTQSNWYTVYTLPKPISTIINMSHSFLDEVSDSYIAYGIWETGELKIKGGENNIRYLLTLSYPVAES